MKGTGDFQLSLIIISRPGGIKKGLLGALFTPVTVPLASSASSYTKAKEFPNPRIVTTQSNPSMDL